MIRQGSRVKAVSPTGRTLTGRIASDLHDNPSLNYSKDVTIWTFDEFQGVIVNPAKWKIEVI